MAPSWSRARSHSSTLADHCAGGASGQRPWPRLRVAGGFHHRASAAPAGYAGALAPSCAGLRLEIRPDRRAGTRRAAPPASSRAGLQRLRHLSPLVELRHAVPSPNHRCDDRVDRRGQLLPRDRAGAQARDRHGLCTWRRGCAEPSAVCAAGRDRSDGERHLRPLLPGLVAGRAGDRRPPARRLLASARALARLLRAGADRGGDLAFHLRHRRCSNKWWAPAYPWPCATRCSESAA